MLFSLIALGVALGLSGVAGWFAIAGLMLTFPAASGAVGMAGFFFEAGKLVGASFLYRYWESAARWLRGVMLILVLMTSVLTSVGIFGFLSRAHFETTTRIEQVETASATTQMQADHWTRQIQDARTTITQLDGVVARVLETNPTYANTLRTRQRTERTTLLTNIANWEDSLVESRSRDTISTQSAIEAELGPLKYLATVIYGEGSVDNTESAVRLLIIFIVCLFDPLALTLVVAANHTFREHRKEIRTQMSAFVDPSSPSTPPVAKPPASDVEMVDGDLTGVEDEDAFLQAMEAVIHAREDEIQEVDDITPPDITELGWVIDDEEDLRSKTRDIKSTKQRLHKSDFTP
jgi:hypothetical protein